MIFDEIVVKESPGLCRCCLSEGCYKDLGSEYTWMNEAEVYADMLLECFDISISQHSEGPNGPNRLICEVCITRLRDACNFKKQVMESEKKFVDMIARGDFRPKVVVYQAPMKAEDTMEEALQDEGEVEYLDGDFDDELLKPDDDASGSEDIPISALPTRGKRGRPKKDKERKAKVPKLEDKPKSSKTLAKDQNRSVKKLNEAAQLRHNIITLFQNTTVVPFRWKNLLLCQYCSQPFIDSLGLKSHYNLDHLDANSRKSLRYRSEMKLDVSMLICKICQSRYKSLETLINHLSTHDVGYDASIKLNLEQYNLDRKCCVTCKEKFLHLSFLIKHVCKKKDNPDDDVIVIINTYTVNQPDNATSIRTDKTVEPKPKEKIPNKLTAKSSKANNDSLQNTSKTRHIPKILVNKIMRTPNKLTAKSSNANNSNSLQNPLKSRHIPKILANNKIRRKNITIEKSQ